MRNGDCKMNKSVQVMAEDVTYGKKQIQAHVKVTPSDFSFQDHNSDALDETNPTFWQAAHT